MDAHRRPRGTVGSSRYDLKLSLVVAACLMIEAVVAKNVLDVRMDYFSQFAALWVFLPYMWLEDQRGDRRTAFAFGLAAVLVTAAVLALYAI